MSSSKAIQFTKIDDKLKSLSVNDTDMPISIINDNYRKNKTSEEYMDSLVGKDFVERLKRYIQELEKGLGKRKLTSKPREKHKLDSFDKNKLNINFFQLEDILSTNNIPVQEASSVKSSFSRGFLSLGCIFQYVRFNKTFGKNNILPFPNDDDDDNDGKPQMRNDFLNKNTSNEDNQIIEVFSNDHDENILNSTVEYRRNHNDLVIDIGNLSDSSSEISSEECKSVRKPASKLLETLRSARHFQRKTHHHWSKQSSETTSESYIEVAEAELITSTINSPIRTEYVIRRVEDKEVNKKSSNSEVIEVKGEEEEEIVRRQAHMMRRSSLGLIYGMNKTDRKIDSEFEGSGFFSLVVDTVSPE